MAHPGSDRPTMNELSPNVRELVIIMTSRVAIPDGGGLADGISFFTNRDKRLSIMTSAEELTKQSINLVRHAAEPNPWRTATDEEIAGEMLRKLDERRKHM